MNSTILAKTVHHGQDFTYSPKSYTKYGSQVYLQQYIPAKIFRHAFNNQEPHRPFPCKNMFTLPVNDPSVYRLREEMVIIHQRLVVSSRYTLRHGACMLCNKLCTHNFQKHSQYIYQVPKFILDFSLPKKSGI